jgi:Asp-tRNA(Asn)/Glu-tRNA(Gln) amidotransferase A subunit family amidase
MGAFSEYHRYDAVGLAELVRRREVTPDELLNAAIARAETSNPAVNAICLPMYEEARSAIAGGLHEGPFTGVPFLLKDLYAMVAGAPLTNGSALFADFVPDRDSELVVRYRRAGLIVFGRTSSPELGLCYTTEPSLYGPTRNPWNLDRVAGGSSGGSAAAVAAGIVPAAHASDGGGSIRVPASCCGLFGLKPTRGRNPAGPLLGEGWAGMSTAHAISRSVRDSAALLDVSSGPDVGDPYWAPPPSRPFADEVGADPGGLRIAVSAEPPNGAAVHPDCIAAMEDAARLCADLGHHVEPATPPYEPEVMDEATSAIVGANVRATIEQRAAVLGRDPSADDVERMTWALAELGVGVDGAAYVKAIQTMHGIGRRIGHWFLDYDVLLTPTLAKPPIPIGALDMMTEDREVYRDQIRSFVAFPVLSNVTGAPAMSVPLYWNAEDLPIGVQFVGRFGDEATLFRLAAQLEAARPWAARRPPLD